MDALLCLLLPVAAPGLVINEVHFDPPGPDAGHEFVELYNDGPVAVPLGGVRLEFVNGSDPSSPSVIWSAAAGAELSPAGYFVVGGSEVVGADAPLGGSLQNGDEAVHLWREHELLDAVAWGEPIAGLGEGAPVEAVPGQSTGRVPDGNDSDHNASDLRALPAPTPGTSNLPEAAFAIRSAVPSPVWSEIAGVVRWDLEVEVRGWAPDQRGELLTGQERFDLLGGPEDTLPVSFDRGIELGLNRFGIQLTTPAGAAASDTLRTFCGPSALVFTEVQPRPAGEEPEWVELVNRSAVRVSLDGWGLRDRGGRFRALDGSRALEAGERHLIVADHAAFVAWYPGAASAASEPTGGWPTLNDNDPGDGVAADSLHLVNPAGLVVDLVTWLADDIEVRGRPLQRSEVVPGQRSLWMPSLSGPTPGEAAPDERRTWPVAGLVCRPDPFDPTRHEMEVLVVGSWSSATGTVFDLSGQVVSPVDLVVSGGRIAGRWDGADARGQPVPSGAYVIVVEAVDENGALERMRSVVGLGRP